MPLCTKMPVYNSFLCIAPHIAVNFLFSVMKFAKSNHRATLKENTWEN